jgi:flagellar hook assembly protein FlgD
VVKDLAVSSPAVTNPAMDFGINTTAFAPQNGQVALILAGGQTFSWTGINNSGQFVQNGTYTIDLTTTDDFGNVQTKALTVTVLSSANTYTLQIFNSAGELVDQLVVANYGSNAPSRISPDKTSIAVGEGSGPSSTINFDLGNGSSIAWDGVNSQGQKVQSGTYLAELVVNHEGTAASVATVSVTVLNVAEGLLDSAILAPNPVNMANGGNGTVILQMNVPSGTAVIGRLYNIAGELVLSSTNQMQPNQLRFDMGGHQASSGIYILAVTAQAPWGTVERKSFKLVMMR